MRRIAFRVLALSSALALAPALRAADAPPGPPKELSQLSSFLGHWTCKGKAFATPFGPEHETEAKVSFSKQLGGYWLLFHYDETKTAKNPMPYGAAGFWGWDAADKVYVERCHDNFGGSCNATSKGWVGDVLTFEGPGSMGGEKMMVRDVFTKKGADVVHSGEMQGKDGKWMKMDEETCTKAAAKK